MTEKDRANVLTRVGADDKERIEMLAEKMIDSVADGTTEAEVINAAVFIIESTILQMKQRFHTQLVGTMTSILLELYGFKADNIESKHL